MNKSRVGILPAELEPSAALSLCKSSNIPIIRLPIFLSQREISINVDFYLANGLNVVPNINWSAIKGTIDLVAYKSKLQTCLEHLLPHIAQIPFIVCENEWDISSWTPDEYVQRLGTFVEVAKSLGFKTTEASISSSALRRWTYSRLFADKAVWWRANYFTGLSDNYDNFIKRIDSFINLFADCNFNKSNVHWYNQVNCPAGFGIAANTYMTACGKRHLICGEVGIMTESTDLFIQTMNELTDNCQYAILYSGVNEPLKAITLTTEMLNSI